MTTAVRRRQRHARILELVAARPISSQEELVQALAREGIDVSQTTISRDIRELQLEKHAGAAGAFYTPANAAEPEAQVLMRLFRETVRSIDHSGEMIVIKTRSGSAGAAAEAIDASFRDDHILGTIAGDNTLFVAVSSPAACAEIASRFRQLLESGDQQP